MSLRINTNVSALTAYQNLNKNQNALSSAIEKLSSGMRINKAADDAAGLSISQGLTSQINGLTQAVSNAQDGVNVAQIADGALGTSQAVLQRMRTLVVQAANSGTQGASSLASIQQELGSLKTQLDNVSLQTSFGGRNLLDGSYNGAFQVGANGGQTIALNLSAASRAALGATASGTLPAARSTSPCGGLQPDHGAHGDRWRDRHGLHGPLGDRRDAEPAHLHVEQPADRDHQRHRIPVEPDRRRPRDRGLGDDAGSDPEPGSGVRVAELQAAILVIVRPHQISS